MGICKIHASLPINVSHPSHKSNSKRYNTTKILFMILDDGLGKQ